MAFFAAPFFASPFFNTGTAQPAGPPRVRFALNAVPVFTLDAAALAFTLPPSATTFILEPDQ